MNDDLDYIDVYLLLKEKLPKLKLVIDNNEGKVYYGTKLLYSTRGHQTEEFLFAYFSGILGAFKMFQ